MERSGDRSGMESTVGGSGMDRTGGGAGMESTGGTDSQQTRGAGEEMPTIPRQMSTPAKYATGPFIYARRADIFKVFAKP